MLLSIYKRIIRGRKKYRDFLSRNNIEGNDWIIIFPGHDMDINHYGLLYIDEFYNWLEYIREPTEEDISVYLPIRRKAFIITNDSAVYESACLFSKRIAGVELWTESDIENITAYYTVYRPGQMIFVSLDRPNGRRCSQLLGKNNIDIKKLVGMGIYGIGYKFFNTMLEQSE